MVVNGSLAPLSAEEFDSFTYEVVGDAVVITDYPDSAAGHVDIPEEINGKAVTSIGKEVLRSYRKLTSVTIPDTVTSSGLRNHCAGEGGGARPVGTATGV